MDGDKNDIRRCLVAVCTYDELENLPSLVEQIRLQLPAADILVVDDNSPDGTGRWADERATSDPQFFAIVRKVDRGLGAAVREAIKFAIEHDYFWLLNLDGDHSHSPADLPRLLALADSTPTLDCVVGTRYVSGGQTIGWPKHRVWMSRLVNRFATGVLRLPVSDCSGSLRCYRVAALTSIEPESLRSRGYAVFEEILVRLRRRNARFGEVPITFHQRKAGESKLTMREAFLAASQIARLAITRWPQ